MSVPYIRPVSPAALSPMFRTTRPEKGAPFMSGLSGGSFLSGSSTKTLLGSDLGLTYEQWQMIGIASGAAATYHGYKRNGTVLMALGWGLLGAMFPVIVIPVALAQGFGQPK